MELELVNWPKGMGFDSLISPNRIKRFCTVRHTWELLTCSKELRESDRGTNARA